MIIIEIFLGLLGLQLANKIEYFTHFIAPAVLILLRVFLTASPAQTFSFT